MSRPILLTRPEPGLGRTAARLQAEGVTVRCLPLLRIEAAGPYPPAVLKLAADWLIFTSRNAVAHAPDWSRPPGRCAAVGQGTADALSDRGWPVDLMPDPFTSEALLAQPALQAVSGKKILLVGGSGGRRTLARELRARGARVDKLISYRRRRVDWSPAALRQAIAGQPVAVFTSGEAMRHWLALAAQAELAGARQLDLVVASQRLCKLARRLGFRQSIEIPARMSDDALMRALQPWLVDD